VSANFNSTTQVTFNRFGQPDNGGTIIVQVGAYQRRSRWMGIRGGDGAMMKESRQQAAAAGRKEQALFLCPLPAARCRLPAAFTLVELVAAMAIVSILLLAILGGAVVRDRGDDRQGALDQAHSWSSATRRIRSLTICTVAMNFTERTSTSVAFTVPPRTGGVPNQVHMHGRPSGHSLYKQFMPAPSPALTAANATYTPVALLPGVTNSI